MAHPQQMAFVTRVKEAHPAFFVGVRVLEVGSQDINGTIRGLFEGCVYLGADLGAGPGVDLVCAGHLLPVPDVLYDVCCSTECFEHDQNWERTFAHMVRLCRPGGLVFFTCATTGRKEHGTAENNPESSPWTPGYYQNRTEEDFRRGADFDDVFQPWRFEVDAEACDLYFVGVKRQAANPSP